jgi:hypothetical protein
VGGDAEHKKMKNEELLEWVGEDYDPESFSVEKVHGRIGEGEKDYMNQVNLIKNGKRRLKKTSISN